MNIELDPEDRKRAEELSRESGKELSQVLGELVHEALETRAQDGSGSRGDSQAIARSQHEEWELLDRELSGLPVSEKATRLSGRDHDEILYGWKKS
jgi:hypothetical protein